MYQPVLNIPRYGGLEMDRDNGSLNSFLPYCRYRSMVLLEKKIVSSSKIDWQDIWVKDFIHMACKCAPNYM